MADRPTTLELQPDPHPLAPTLQRGSVVGPLKRPVSTDRTAPDGRRDAGASPLAPTLEPGSQKNFVPDGVPVIRGGSLNDGFVDDHFVYLTESKADQLKNANAFPGDVVITHRGTLGQVGLIPRDSRYRRYVVSQSQMLIRPNPDALPSHLLYLFLTSMDGQHQLLANKSQTGVPAISRPTQSVKSIRVVVAGSLFSNLFESMVATLFECRAGIVAESRKLAEMRDYLLPKLLTGQVSVSDAESATEALL